MSLMDLHWLHTPQDPSLSSETLAHAELTAFLRARERKVRQGGLLLLAYISRSSEQHRDMWTVLSDTIAPCIQRLVSCGMLKADVARHMLALPIHPRSKGQTLAVLDQVDDRWSLEWSCGLGRQDPAPSDLQPAPSEPEPLRFPHPAWLAMQNGTLSRVAWAEHCVQLIRNFYEDHWRALLKKRVSARRGVQRALADIPPPQLSKGASEFILDSLFDVLHSRIGDDDTPLDGGIELEVCLCALRRI